MSNNNCNDRTNSLILSYTPPMMRERNKTNPAFSFTYRCQPGLNSANDRMNTNTNSNININNNNNNNNNNANMKQSSKQSAIGHKRKRTNEEDDTRIISSPRASRLRLSHYGTNDTTTTPTTTTTTTYNNTPFRFDPRKVILQSSLVSTSTINKSNENATSTGTSTNNSSNNKLNTPIKNKNNNKTNNDNNNNDSQGVCHMDTIPKELFFKIISFIGPTSSSLISLMQINKRYSTIMNQVAVAILERAKSKSYQCLLPHLYKNESLMVQCVRHTRCFHDVMNKYHQLKCILEKDFVRGCIIDALSRGCITLPTIHEINRATSKNGGPGTGTGTGTGTGGGGDGNQSEGGHDRFDNGNVADSSSSSSSSTGTCGMSGLNSNSPITPIQIDKALDIALDLLGADNVTYFLSNKTNVSTIMDQLHPDFFGSASGSGTNGGNGNGNGSSVSWSGSGSTPNYPRKNILSYFTEEIENQILSLCGKCGGKIFKYIKMMSLFSDYHALVVEAEEDGDTSAPAPVPAPVPVPEVVPEVVSAQVLAPPPPPPPQAIRIVQLWKDRERMDRSRLIMQLVMQRLLIMDRSCSKT